MIRSQTSQARVFNEIAWQRTVIQQRHCLQQLSRDGIEMRLDRLLAQETAEIGEWIIRPPDEE